MGLVELAVFERRVEVLEAEVSKVMGVINAAHGRLVDLLGEALDEDLWKVWGIHSPGHWLAWQAGISTGRAAAIAKVAERRGELPSAVAALRAGEVSVDAAIEVARRAPAGYEESITDFARVATISQLRRCLRRYAYDDETDQAKPKPREDTRSVSMGTDHHGWWLKGRMGVDEGAVVEQAIRAARDDLYRQERAHTPDGEPVRDVSLADGLLAVGEASLAAGQARFPGTDRYQVHIHLEGSPDTSDPTGVAALHLGPALPAALRALLLCDAEVRAVFHTDGHPVSVGRRSRVISRRLRRVIEHRDGGCRVPGCGRTAGLEIHHIVHWENGGPTDTANLVAVCRFHHRLHHRGLLGIAGDADTQGQTGLVCTDRFGRRLDPAGQPIVAHPHNNPASAAAGLGIHPGHYHHPLGERLDTWSVTFNPNRPPPHRPERVPADPNASTSPARPGDLPDPDGPGGRRDAPCDSDPPDASD